MGRIRTVKPDTAKHSGLYDLEQATGLPIRFAWVMLWGQCDREGRFRWRPRELKVEILPYDDVDFNQVLESLRAKGFVVRYAVGAEIYGAILSWKKHQVVNNKERPSEIPAPTDEQIRMSMENVLVIDASTTRRPRVVTRNQDEKAEGKGKEYGKEHIEPSPASPERKADNDSADVLPQDSKHKRLKAMIQNAYREQNGVECPWDGSEARQLKALIDATSLKGGWPDHQYAQCLHNMYASKGFPKGKRPREFIPRLTNYLRGPLNEFNREVSGNGHASSKADQRAAEIRESTRRVFESDPAISGNATNRLQNQAAGRGIAPLAGNPQRLLVPGVRPGDEAPDKKPSKV